MDAFHSILLDRSELQTMQIILKMINMSADKHMMPKTFNDQNQAQLVHH